MFINEGTGEGDLATNGGGEGEDNGDVSGTCWFSLFVVAGKFVTGGAALNEEPPPSQDPSS